MNPAETSDPRLVRLGQRSLVVGVAGLALCTVGASLSLEQFFRSYLLGYLFWIGIALGSFAVVMLHRLVGGGWGLVIQRFLEAGTGTIPLLALLVVPLLFGLQELYVWARPEAVGADEFLAHKSAYLNVPFFIVRVVLYFAIWGALAYGLNRQGSGRGLRWINAPGLALLVLTVTFASVDWVMSLEPHFFSTIFGFLFLAGDVLAALAFSVCVLTLLAGRGASVERVRDLGNLLLTFVLLWAYLAFSQYLIIWLGNLPEEISWYTNRTGHGWVAISVALIVFHFAVPFAVLLSRRVKRAGRNLMAVAALILLMRWVDLYWHVAPSFHGSQMTIHWMDLAAPIGIGGMWLAVFAWQLRKGPIVPMDGPGGER